MSDEITEKDFVKTKTTNKSNKDKKKGKSSKKGAVIAIMLFLIVLIIGGGIWGWITIFPGYLTKDSAISNYYKAISEQDSRLYKNTCYTKKWSDDYSTDSGQGLNDMIQEAFSLQSGASYSGVELVSQEKLDKEYADKMVSSVRTRYGVDIKVSQVERVNFTVNTVFEGASEKSGTITRYCYKSRGKWYFLADPEVIVDLGVEG